MKRLPFFMFLSLLGVLLILVGSVTTHVGSAQEGGQPTPTPPVTPPPVASSDAVPQEPAEQQGQEQAQNSGNIQCVPGYPSGAGDALGGGMAYLAKGQTRLFAKVTAPQPDAKCMQIIGENVEPVDVFIIEGGDVKACTIEDRLEDRNGSMERVWKVSCPDDSNHDRVPIPWRWDSENKILTIGPKKMWGKLIPLGQFDSFTGWSTKAEQQGFAPRSYLPVVIVAYIQAGGDMGGWAPWVPLPTSTPSVSP